MLDDLVELIARTDFDELPDAAVQAAQTFILDTLAVGVAGRRNPYRDAVLGVADAWGQGEMARILGGSVLVPAPTAAFVNAYQMHCLEFDCVHEPAVVHAMTAVLAAALAECEQAAAPVSGRRFIAAATLGVEVAALLGMAATAPLTFFRPATAGVFGAAAAVAALRNYGAARIRSCFGHALCHAAGTMQAHEEGKPTLPVQLGNAARAGLVAADLAAAGVPAPEDALEGPYGYFALFERSFDTAGLAETLGKVWRVTELSHKPYPSGRATHGGVEAVLQLRGQGVTAKALKAMRLSAPPLIHQLVVRPPLADMNVNYARLCFPYVGATALLHGTVGLEHFTAEVLQDAEVLAVAQRFSASVNEVADPAAFTPQTLTAELADGSVLAVRIDQLPGSPSHPLSQAQRQAKVRTCLGSVYADEARADALLDAVAALPQTADAKALLEPITDGRAQTPAELLQREGRAER